MDIAAIAATLSPEEKAKAHKRLMEQLEPFAGVRVTYWFDEKDDRCKHLSPITLVSVPPRVGDIVSIRSHVLEPDPDRNFRQVFQFVVDQIYVCITAAANAKEKLIYGDAVSHHFEAYLRVNEKLGS
jgi:hypothetical protein